MDSGRMMQRGAQMFAMLVIGDGFLAMLQPDRHLRLGKGWSDTTDRWLEALAERPGLTRLAGAATVAAGLALAYNVQADENQDQPQLQVPVETVVVEQEEVVTEIGY